MAKELCVEDKKTTALLLWSGGVDSTYILMEFIRTGMIGELYFDHLTVIETDFQSISGNYQNNMARIAIKRQIEVLYGDVSGMISFKTEKPELSQFEYGDGLMQPLIWLFIAVYAAQKKDTLVFGYVKGDQFWHKRTAFDNTILFAKEIIGKELVTHYPLEWAEKSEVIRFMNSSHKSIYNLYWYCESFKLFPCGTCESCKAHKTHEQHWKEDDETGVLEMPKETIESYSESGVMTIPKSS